MRWLLLVLLLSACTQARQVIEEGGSEAFDEMESASALALKASRRYECRLARVGPLLDEYDTQEERDAWAIRCKTTNRLPDFSRSPADTDSNP